MFHKHRIVLSLFYTFLSSYLLGIKVKEAQKDINVYKYLVYI